MLTEAGYYSWQEKIMNGHSPFPPFCSSQFLSATHQIFVGGKSYRTKQGRFSNRREENKDSLTLAAKTFTLDALD